MAHLAGVTGIMDAQGLPGVRAVEGGHWEVGADTRLIRFSGLDPARDPLRELYLNSRLGVVTRLRCAGYLVPQTIIVAALVKALEGGAEPVGAGAGESAALQTADAASYARGHVSVLLGEAHLRSVLGVLGSPWLWDTLLAQGR